MSEIICFDADITQTAEQDASVHQLHEDIASFVLTGSFDADITQLAAFDCAEE